MQGIYVPPRLDKLRAAVARVGHISPMHRRPTDRPALHSGVHSCTLMIHERCEFVYSEALGLGGVPRLGLFPHMMVWQRDETGRCGHFDLAVVLEGGHSEVETSDAIPKI